MIKDLLLPKIKKSFMIIEKGISIHEIEYILLYHYGFYYYNSDDPHKDTQHKIGDLSDGIFHFFFFMNENDNKKYMSMVSGAQYINGDYKFNDKIIPCYSANQLLRDYKLKKINKKINGQKKTYEIIN